MPQLELVGAKRLDGHRDVLLLAASIGKPEVDELDLFLLDQLQHVGGRGHAGSPGIKTGLNAQTHCVAKAGADSI